MTINVRVLNDGYIWLIVTPAEAQAMMQADREIYKLYDDGSEGLCETVEDITSHPGPLGVSVGFILHISPRCPRCGKPLINTCEDGWECSDALNCNKFFSNDELPPYVDLEQL